MDKRFKRRINKGWFKKGHKPVAPFKKGQPSWNKKEWIKLSCSQCNKDFSVPPARINKAKFCSKICSSKNRIGKSSWNKGGTSWAKEKKFSEIHRKKIGEGHKGKKHYNWKDGITPLRKKAWFSIEYKQWRKQVFERDDYRCMDCGKRGGGQLEADHILQWSKYPHLRYEINNGQTLCKSCHIQKTRFDRTGIYNFV